MSGIQCACGRFLAEPRAIPGWHNFGDAFLASVRGNCSRCGPGVEARTGDNAWWWSWDAWAWPEGIE